MPNNKYKKPEEILPKEENVPISARVRKGLVEDLKAFAAVQNNPLSGFIEEILEDYVRWAKKTSQNEKVRKK